MNYSLFLENLKKRRYDEAIKEHVLSDGFKRSKYPDVLKYTLESMVEIDPSYAYKVYANSRRIHEKIMARFKKKGIKVDYRYQGDLKTFSNILLYGDVEIIVIDKLSKEKPHVAIKKITGELLDALKDDPSFKSVNYNDQTRIRIIASKPTCEIDLLPSVWVDSNEYIKSHNEIYRGIAEFDFKRKRVKKYLPFLNIARLNARDQRTNGNFRSLVRLLKSLKTDSEENIQLKNADINSIVYKIPESKLQLPPGKLLAVFPLIDKLLAKLAWEDKYFAALKSPSEKDRIFASRPEAKDEVIKLHKSFKQLMQDVQKELAEKKLTFSSSGINY
ncbi:MAG: hypothetical protein AAF789_03020 [Bacteroidota bacterium]